MTGFASSWIQQIEDGFAAPGPDDLKSLAKVYGCSVAWLTGHTTELSQENLALLRTVESTNDRDTLRRFMLMISTRDDDESPRMSARERLANIALREDVPVAAKVRYVKRQAQTRKHHCHWPECDKQVPPAMWGCKEHWFRLPKTLRDRIWRSFKPGQEVDMTPSAEYLDVANEVQQWIRENLTTS